MKSIRCKTITWTNDDPNHWRIYKSVCLNVLIFLGISGRHAEISYTNSRFRAWIDNYIHTISWDVITDTWNGLSEKITDVITFPHTLTHWGRVTHICVGKLTNIGSDNGLSPDRRQAIIWTNAGLLLIGPLGTNFSEILIKILTFSFKKMRLKVSSAKRRPFCLGLNVLISVNKKDH